MSDSVSLWTVFKWTVFPFANFIVWYYIGLHQRGCPMIFTGATNIPAGGALENIKVVYDYTACDLYLPKQSARRLSISHMPKFIRSDIAGDIHFGKLKMDEFENYKKDRLVHLKSATVNMFELNFHNQPCATYVHVTAETKPFTCLAVVGSSSSPGSLKLLRFNKDNKKTGRVFNTARPSPSGIFRNVANKKGRASQRSYTQPFLEHLQEVESQILAMMARRGLVPGSDVTLMVTNDGEIDLFLNYACSCRAHNISLDNAIVFTGSRWACVCMMCVCVHSGLCLMACACFCFCSELVSVIRATGAMGYYHPSFTTVPRKASGGYLDKVFVMMMWYKAFSLYVLLHMGFHVLFQDVDLVWFRSPFAHLHRNMQDAQGQFQFEAYLSDDGARAIRYSPYFANSGFYYLRSTESTRSFSYSVMLGFDILHATGSHQNVFTFRLLENAELFPAARKKFLSLLDFPSGVKFHHDKGFMKKIVAQQAHPFIFHMCWTGETSYLLS